MGFAKIGFAEISFVQIGSTEIGYYCWVRITPIILKIDASSQNRMMFFVRHLPLPNQLIRYQLGLL